MPAFQDYRRLRLSDPGATPAKVKARNYYSPSKDHTVSRRQYDKEVKTGAFTGTPPKPSRAPKKVSTYSRILARYTERYNSQARALGIPEVNKNEAKTHKTFKDAYKTIKRDGKSPKGSPKRAPLSAFALALEDVGLRATGLDVFVGDTPD